MRRSRSPGHGQQRQRDARMATTTPSSWVPRVWPNRGARRARGTVGGGVLAPARLGIAGGGVG